MAIPLQQSDPDGHYCRCPICGHMVDELDLEEVIQHLDEHHTAPTRN